jgi:hypothetical protein
MKDPCQPQLLRAPHVTATAGWIWSQQNLPTSTDDNLSGKWMLFPRCGDAVSAWRSVADAGHGGRIWLAKISPQARRESHLICVYTPDFTNQPDVVATVELLAELGLVDRKPSTSPTSSHTWASTARPADVPAAQASTSTYPRTARCVPPRPSTEHTSSWRAGQVDHDAALCSTSLTPIPKHIVPPNPGALSFRADSRASAESRQFGTRSASVRLGPPGQPTDRPCGAERSVSVAPERSRNALGGVA